MTRAIINFKDDSFINIPADGLEFNNNIIKVWNNGALVAITKLGEITSCHLSEPTQQKI